jgi:hypothetical protein
MSFVLEWEWERSDRGCDCCGSTAHLGPFLIETWSSCQRSSESFVEISLPRDLHAWWVGERVKNPLGLAEYHQGVDDVESSQQIAEDLLAKRLRFLREKATSFVASDTPSTPAHDQARELIGIANSYLEKYDRSLQAQAELEQRVEQVQRAFDEAAEILRMSNSTSLTPS